MALDAEAIKQVPIKQVPLSQRVFRLTRAPDAMERIRVGIGGQQPAEVNRMLGLARDTPAKDKAWLAERNAKSNAPLFKVLRPR